MNFTNDFKLNIAENTVIRYKGLIFATKSRQILGEKSTSDVVLGYEFGNNATFAKLGGVNFGNDTLATTWAAGYKGRFGGNNAITVAAELNGEIQGKLIVISLILLFRQGKTAVDCSQARC